MTTPDIPMPYDLQFRHDTAASTTYMTLPPAQRQTAGGGTGQLETERRHYLPQGTYMISASYSGAESLEVTHARNDGQSAYTLLTIPAGPLNSHRLSGMKKISVLNSGEFISVLTTPRTGSGASSFGRATISVFPSETYKPA